MNQEIEIDRTLLDKILSHMDFENKHKNWNMMQVVDHIYCSTYMYFKLSFYEEKNLRMKYEKTILAKNERIEELEEKIKELTSGEDSPSESVEEAEGPTQLDLFHQGS